LSKIQRVTTLADRHWAGEKSPACGRAVFSCCFYCKGCVKCQERSLDELVGMGALVFGESLKVALALLHEGGVFGIGHPTHHALVTLGAHLRGELAATLDRGVACRGSCCGGGSVTHIGILYRPAGTHLDETVMNGAHGHDIYLFFSRSMKTESGVFLRNSFLFKCD